MKWILRGLFGNRRRQVTVKVESNLVCVLVEQRLMLISVKCYELEGDHEMWQLKSARLGAPASRCNQCCNAFVINVNVSTVQSQRPLTHWPTTQTEH